MSTLTLIVITWGQEPGCTHFCSSFYISRVWHMLKCMKGSQTSIQLIMADRIEMRTQLCCLFGNLACVGLKWRWRFWLCSEHALSPCLPPPVTLIPNIWDWGTELQWINIKVLLTLLGNFPEILRPGGVGVEELKVSRWTELRFVLEILN